MVCAAFQSIRPGMDSLAHYSGSCLDGLHVPRHSNRGNDCNSGSESVPAYSEELPHLLRLELWGRVHRGALHFGGSAPLDARHLLCRGVPVAFAPNASTKSVIPQHSPRPRLNSDPIGRRASRTRSLYLEKYLTQLALVIMTNMPLESRRRRCSSCW